MKRLETEKLPLLEMGLSESGFTIFCSGMDGPGEKVLNERQVLLDLSGSE